MSVSAVSSQDGTANSSQSSGSASSSAPKLTSTQQNLENLLVQYGTSESRDVQDLLAHVADQLGVNIADVRAAAQADAQTQKDVQAKADKEKAVADAQIAATAKESRKHQKTVDARRAEEAYRRHRLNDWHGGYARRAAAANAAAGR